MLLMNCGSGLADDSDDLEYGPTGPGNASAPINSEANFAGVKLYPLTSSARIYMDVIMGPSRENICGLFIFKGQGRAFLKVPEKK